jgi:hypothetical protein
MAEVVVGISVLAATAANAAGAPLALTAFTAPGALAGLSALGPLALSIGLSVGSAALQAEQQRKALQAARAKNSNSAQKATFRQAIMPRRIAYGRTMVSNIYAFIDTADDSGKGGLYIDHIICEGPVDGFERFFYGSEMLGLSDSIVVYPARFNVTVDGESENVLAIESYTGWPDQNYPNLLNTAMPSQWTANHRLQGIAHLASRMWSVPPAEFARVYPQGQNVPIRPVVRGARVWDPFIDDTGTVKSWTRSPARMMADLLTHPEFFNIPITELDRDSFVDAYLTDDALLPMVSGQTRPRWACDGVVTFDTEPRRALQQIADTCDREVFLTSAGKIGLRGGKLETPTVTIGPSEILGASFTPGPDLFDTANVIEPIYVSPEHAWEQVNGVEVRDEDSVEIAGEIRESLELPFVTTHDQARQLARIRLARLLAPWKGTLRLSLSALRVWDERVITVQFPDLDIDGPFRITRRSLNEDLTQIELDIEWWDGSAYERVEYEAPPVVPFDSNSEATPIIPIPQEVDAVHDEGRIFVSWSIYGQGDWLPEVSYRLTTGDWSTVLVGRGQRSVYIPVPSGTYQVYVRWLTFPNLYFGPTSTVETVVIP